MILLTPEQAATLKNWFLPDRPGPLIGLHVIHTGHGACFVDRWPAPRTVLVEAAGNYTILGASQALTPADLRVRIRGFVETSEPMVPLLESAFPGLSVWNRVVFEQQQPPDLDDMGGHPVRRLQPSDTHHLWGMSPEVAWIARTWGGPTGLSSSGFAWGAFVEGQLVSVACTFFLGETYEDIGVATEPAFRGLGLGTACVRALLSDIQARRHVPSWTTSPENTASMRIAEKLGFEIQREDRLYVVGTPVPAPVQPSTVRR